MPPRVLAEELTVMTLDVMTTLDTRLAISDGYIIELDVVGAK